MYIITQEVAFALLRQCLFGKKEQSIGVDKNAVAAIHLNSSGKEGVVSYVPQTF